MNEWMVFQSSHFNVESTRRVIADYLSRDLVHNLHSTHMLFAVKIATFYPFPTCRLVIFFFIPLLSLPSVFSSYGCEPVMGYCFSNLTDRRQYLCALFQYPFFMIRFCGWDIKCKAKTLKMCLFISYLTNICFLSLDVISRFPLHTSAGLIC